MEMMKKVGLIALLAAACAAGYYLTQSKMSESQNVMIQKKFNLGKTIKKFSTTVPDMVAGNVADGTGTNKRCSESSACDRNLYCFKKDYSNKTSVGNCHRKQDAGHDCHENRACLSNICSNGKCK